MVPKKKIVKEAEVDTKHKSNESILRLQNDIKIFKERADKFNEFPCISLEFPKDDSINPVHIVIKPQVGFYKNSKITFVYTITEEYPFKAPIVECKQRVFHPNIDCHRKVCLSILKDNWMANNELCDVAHGLRQILECLSLVDIEKPLDARAAELMKQDAKKYQEIVEKTLKGQAFEGEQFDNVWIK